MSFHFRRSETAEQHDFEQRIHNDKFGMGWSDPTHNGRSKMKAAYQNGGTVDTEKGRGVLYSLKKQIKSSFPEAIQDLKIMGSMTA